MYKKNFLTHVIFKLDFSDIAHFQHENKLQELYERYLKDNFAYNEIAKSVDLSISIKDNVQTVNQNTKYQLICKNSSDEKDPTFILDKNNLIIDIQNRYTNLEKFIEIVKTCLMCIDEVKDSIDITRLGLRYINEIELPLSNNVLSNESYINNNLTSKELKFLGDDLQKNMTRSLSQTEFSLDEYNVRFVNGYFNNQYPAKILDNSYVIDIDCYVNAVEYKEVIGLIEKMNKDTITPLFERSIEDGLRNLLGGND